MQLINKQSPKHCIHGNSQGAVETHTPGFCRAYRRETVDGHGRRIFQMARSGKPQQITLLREIGNTFERWGIPLQVMMDNGPQFISQQFEQFMKANNCKHTRTSPIILSRMGWQSALCSPLSKLSGPPEKRSHWHTG